MHQVNKRNFLIDEYLAAAKSSNAIAAVWTESSAARPPLKDPFHETQWMQREADRTGFPQAILGIADLMAPGAEALLERHRRLPNMRLLVQEQHHPRGTP